MMAFFFYPSLLLYVVHSPSLFFSFLPLLSPPPPLISSSSLASFVPDSQHFLFLSPLSLFSHTNSTTALPRLPRFFSQLFFVSPFLPSSPLLPLFFSRFTSLTHLHKYFTSFTSNRLITEVIITAASTVSGR